VTRPKREVDLATIEEQLEDGSRLRPGQREILLRLLRGKTNPASVRRQIKSAKAAGKARRIVFFYYGFIAMNPGVPRKVIVADVMKACGLKSRSYVYEAKRELEQTDPKWVKRVRIDAAMMRIAFGPKIVDAFCKRGFPLK
jgi:hypothetical protein